MDYENAGEVIREWMDEYSVPVEVEDALKVALLALKRCEYFDMIADKRKGAYGKKP